MKNISPLKIHYNRILSNIIFQQISKDYCAQCKLPDFTIFVMYMSIQDESLTNIYFNLRF